MVSLETLFVLLEYICYFNVKYVDIEVYDTIIIFTIVLIIVIIVICCRCRCYC